MKPAKILILEDDPAFRERLSRNIQSWFDVEIETLSDGPQALQRIGTESFDVVLTNVTLPGVHWVKVIEAVKKKDLRSVVFVIASTDNMGLTDAIGRAGGFFLQRPVEDHWIRKMIVMACKRRNIPVQSFPGM